ncbi:MAG: aminotransferase class I/II-fold pyridoxal phosphate-dependent enzyme [Candidatus Limivivens sp.]|nr:aminotransferase class I/II-fold pyridoxal phosphate-dependent enzyme [Candidatus Limivivens sp.]
MKQLYDLLKEYGGSRAYPFHMPGHKRQNMDFGNPFSIDITEIDGFDNLHHPEGILKEAQERLAALRGCTEAFFMVNGSTGGILSAVSACTEPGDRILMARNCHKAVYHAVYLRNLQPVYLYPRLERKYGISGGLVPGDLERLLGENPDIRAVVVTSPTYDGVVSDVKKLAEIAHKYGIPLIVDEAHGAHFGFHGYFPVSAVNLGADLVIQSFHKTLPSLTQTAVLYRNGTLVDRERLTRFLGIYQTSSPSYVFLASIDRCTGILAENGKELFGEFAGRLECFRRKAASWKRIQVPGREITGESGIFDLDLSKLILSVRGFCSGEALSRRLREGYALELEMAAGGYALALTSFEDTQEGFDRLEQALREIDRGLEGSRQPCEIQDYVFSNERVCSPAEAWDGPKRIVNLEDSEGMVSGEFLYLYPPGIPLLVPGERISRELLQRVHACRENGLSLQGPADYSCREIRVLTAEETGRICS